MKKRIKHFVNSSKQRATALVKRDSIERGIAVPKITNETVAEQRERVLSGARKYIYPLQHSKHRIVLVSSGIFIALILSFLTFCVVSLYKLQSTNTFVYRITQVLPFPVARQGKNFVSYENYLFELRHYMHYYENQQKLSFESESGKQQLQSYKQRALDKVIADMITKQAADERGVFVTNKDVEDQIDLARSQNRLGGSDKVFEDVLRDYWGWTINDYKRSLRGELLEQKLAAKVDEESAKRAADIASQLHSGADFKTLAASASADDQTKQAGGELGLIDKSDRDMSPQSIDALFKLAPGAVSEPILIAYRGGFAYEIVKNIEAQGSKIKAAHVVILIKDFNEFLNDYKAGHPVKQYVRIPTAPR